MSEAAACQLESSTKQVTKLLPSSACEETAQVKKCYCSKKRKHLCKSPIRIQLWKWTKALPTWKHFSQRLSVSPADRLFAASQSAQRRPCSCFRAVRRQQTATSTRPLAPAA